MTPSSSRARQKWRSSFGIIEVVAIITPTAAGIAVSTLDFLGLFDQSLHTRIPTLTLLLVGIVGGQLAFERYGQIRRLNDQQHQANRNISAVNNTLTEVGVSVNEVRDSVRMHIGDSRFDAMSQDICSDLRAALQVAVENQVFYDAMCAQLEDVVRTTRDWRYGQLDTRGTGYHQVLIGLYQNARSSVVSTSSQRYVSTWNESLGERLRLAHARSPAAVTRIFIFDNREMVSTAAVDEMRRQNAYQSITVRLYFKNSDPLFQYPSDISEDFTVIDNGSAIGMTVKFGEESQLTAKWYFNDSRMISRFRRIVEALRDGSISYADYEDQCLSETAKQHDP